MLIQSSGQTISFKTAIQFKLSASFLSNQQQFNLSDHFFQICKAISEMASLVPFMLFILVVILACFGSPADANEQVRLKVTPGECYELVRLATAGDRADMVELLVNQGCSVNRLPGSTSKENTPLHIAVVNGNLDMVKKLVNYGADVNARAHQAAELDKKKCAACKYLLIHD